MTIPNHVRDLPFKRRFDLYEGNAVTGWGIRYSRSSADLGTIVRFPTEEVREAQWRVEQDVAQVTSVAGRPGHPTV